MNMYCKRNSYEEYLANYVNQCSEQIQVQTNYKLDRFSKDLLKTCSLLVEDKLRKQRQNSDLKLVTAFGLILCSIGVTFQLYHCSTEYFEYEVISEVTVYRPSIIVPPALTICVRYEEITRDVIRNYSEIAYQKVRIKLIQQTFTIGQLMTLIPDIDQFLVSAWIRKRDSFYIDLGLKLLTVQMFIKDYYVCYRFTHIDHLHPKFGFRLEHVFFGSEPGTLLELTLDKPKVSDYCYILTFCSMIVVHN